MAEQPIKEGTVAKIATEIKGFRENPKAQLARWTETGRNFLKGVRETAKTQPKQAIKEIADAPSEVLLVNKTAADSPPVAAAIKDDEVPKAPKRPLYTELSKEQLEEIHRNNREAAIRELEEKIKISPAVEYPDTRVMTETPTPEQIAESVSQYISWRRAHEDVEGVREPGRAEILGHATSVEGARGILMEGELRSIKNLLCSDNPRVDLMQGGKAKFIAGSTSRIVEANSELQKTVVENRTKILEYTPWLDSDAKEDVLKSLQAADSVQAVVDLTDFIIENGYRKNVWPGMSRTGVYQRHPPWNIITNLLPKEARQKIALSADPEPYVSTTLGHALEIYTPDKANASRQAAVVTLDVGQIPRDHIYMHGGTDRYAKATDHEWTMAVKETAGLPARIFTHEASYGGSAVEVNIQDDNPEGTAIHLRTNATVLLPASQEHTIRLSLPAGDDITARLNNVIWFDDAKFRSIDEVIGWMVTTPEGRSLYRSKVESQPA